MIITQLVCEHLQNNAMIAKAFKHFETIAKSYVTVKQGTRDKLKTISLEN